MKDVFTSIRFRVWLLFISFALAIIAFLYTFQIAMLPNYYEYMKTKETIETTNLLKSAWNLDDTSKVTDLVYSQAEERKMFIEISENNRLYTRRNATGRTNMEISELIRDNKESFMQDSGNAYFTATVPRSSDSSKALIVRTTIGTNEDGDDIYLFIFNYLEPLGTTTNILHSQINLTAIAILLCAFIMSVFISSNISRPIIRISNSAKKLSTGEFNLKVKPHEYMEINELTENLNAASKEIAKADNLRKDLMANISHDLRTPLTMIKAYAEMIRDLSGNNPEKREKHLKVIIDETDRLSSLVSDILDLSKLQSGVAEMNMETFDFSEHLESVVSRFAFLKESEGYDVQLNAEEKIYITADITKLEQVVYNLINNAVTYTGDDKIVRVNLFKTKQGKVRFEVVDSGIGIDEENLKYIWDRYYKVKHEGETHKRAVMGSGIGLSIVKGVLEMHNFDYGATSTVGVGSTFWFECAPTNP